MLQQQITYCTSCGAPIRVDSKTLTVTCENCDTPFIYRPEIKYNAFLLIPGDNKKKYEFPIKSNLLIGRNNRDILTITDELNTSLVQTIPVRNAYVSNTHINIKINNELVIITHENEECILNKMVCSVIDMDSTNGTDLNHMPLTNNNEAILQNGAIITLAPNTRKPLKIEYVEKRI